jgi:hypothetical protein
MLISMTLGIKLSNCVILPPEHGKALAVPSPPPINKAPVHVQSYCAKGLKFEFDNRGQSFATHHSQMHMSNLV